MNVKSLIGLLLRSNVQKTFFLREDYDFLNSISTLSLVSKSDGAAVYLAGYEKTDYKNATLFFCYKPRYTPLNVPQEYPFVFHPRNSHCLTRP